MSNRTAFGMVMGLGAVLAFAVPAMGSEFQLYGSQTSDAPDSFRFGLVKFAWPVTGQSIRIGNAGVLFDGDFAGDGTLYAPGTGLMRVDTTTGAAVQIGSWGIPNQGFIVGLAVAPDGRVFGVDNEGINTSLYEISTATGRATRIGRIGDVAVCLDFGPDGVLYGGGRGVFPIDIQTGARGGANVIPASAGLQQAIDFGADGIWRSIVQVAGPDRLLQLNFGSASTELIGLTSESRISGLASIPTPGVGVGAAVVMAMAARGRRRRA